MKVDTRGSPLRGGKYEDEEGVCLARTMRAYMLQVSPAQFTAVVIEAQMNALVAHRQVNFVCMKCS